MALFSFRHSVKTFSKKAVVKQRIARSGQTLSHIKYICRAGAARVVIKSGITASFSEFSKTYEDKAQKKSGRVAERFIIALPVEANHQQREIIATEFANAFSKGKAPYIVAIHDKSGNDVNNPHLHMIVFDATEVTGKKGRPKSVLGMTSNGAIERTAQLWCAVHNKCMDEFGFLSTSQIDNRSYVERRISRLDTIHEGAAARVMRQKNSPLNVNRDWVNVDGGNTRHEANAIIKEINSLRLKVENDGNELGRGVQEHSKFTGKDAEIREPYSDVGGRVPPFASKRANSFPKLPKKYASGDEGNGDHKAWPRGVAIRDKDNEAARSANATLPPFLESDVSRVVRIIDNRFDINWKTLLYLRDSLMKIISQPKLIRKKTSAVCTLSSNVRAEGQDIISPYATHKRQIVR